MLEIILYLTISNFKFLFDKTFIQFAVYKFANTNYYTQREIDKKKTKFRTVWHCVGVLWLKLQSYISNSNNCKPSLQIVLT